jgi:hypothetical protein
MVRSMSRREAILSASAVFLVALGVRAWAATQITFPRPEDVAYYVGVARNLVEGRGLVTDAIWSFQTPPLAFPRPAFEVWLPLPSFLAAAPMSVLGTTFVAAQVSSVVVGSIVCVLAWRLAADVAAARSMPIGRARTLALGAGLTSAVYLPLVLGSAQPDSTMPFAVLVLVACLLMNRALRPIAAQDVSLSSTSSFIESTRRLARARARVLWYLGITLGIAALTRNEAAWLAITWAIVAWWIAGRVVVAQKARPVRGASSVGRPTVGSASTSRFGHWWPMVVGVGLTALLVFLPWAYRDWQAFGSPFPGQALANALSLDGRDIFAWQDQPTLARYLAAGAARLLELRVEGTVHNLVSVLLLLGIPLSVLGLLGLPLAWRVPAGQAGAANPLRPLIVFSVITFAVASLVFPVSTTWGTFLHAAGTIHVLLVISALLVLDRLIVWVGARRGWTRPVAWLGPAFAIAGCVLFSFVLLVSDGAASRAAATRYAALAAALTDGSADVLLADEPGPVITDFPIWLAESTRHPAIALPNEPAASILDLAGAFDPPARLLIVSASNEGRWPATILAGDPGTECFVPVSLPDPPAHPGALNDFLVFRIRCP